MFTVSTLEIKKGKIQVAHPVYICTRGVKNETANKDLIRIQRVSPSFLVTRRMATPFFIFLQGKLLRHFSFLGKHCILRHLKFFSKIDAKNE